MHKIYIILFILCSIVTVLSQDNVLQNNTSQQNANASRTPAALFAGQIITKEEVYDALLKNYPDQVQAVLSEIALHRMIQLECQEKKINIPKSKIQEESKAELLRYKKEIKNTLGIEWNEYLQQHHANEREVQQKIWLKCKYSLALHALIRLKELEVDLIDARHILVETREKAEQIRTQILKGADFGALARKESLSQTGQQGGKITKIARGDIKDAKLEEVIFSLAPYEISPVIESLYGFHIWQVLKIYPARQNITWENVSNEIWSSLKKTPVQDRDFQLWFKTVEKKYPLRKF
jgi:foldase protein PrsA